MSVEVIRDLAHHSVHGEPGCSKTLPRHSLELSDHVLDGLGRRFGSMLIPHDHRDVADLAVGHPADVVLMVPRSHPGGLAQVARCFAGPGSAHPATVGRRAGADGRRDGVTQ
jgi:hypothetical protein